MAQKETNFSSLLDRCFTAVEQGIQHIVEKHDPMNKTNVRADMLGDGGADIPAPHAPHERWIEAEAFSEGPDDSQAGVISSSKQKAAPQHTDIDVASIPFGETHAKSNDTSFSPLMLRDRVVVMLLFYEVVRVEQVERAWEKMQRTASKDPLWRLLAQDPELDRERIFAIAAEVYAFEDAHINRLEALAFLRDIADSFTEPQWKRMSELRLVPVAQHGQAKSKDKRWVFATHDPVRPEVKTLLQELKLTQYELRYAPESVVAGLLSQALPQQNEYLRRMKEDSLAFDLGMSYVQQATLIDEDALEAEISRSSLINLFEATLVEAVRQGASDIHIFPNANRQIAIHFRVDGELNCWHTEERVHPEAFLAVVKDNSMNVDRFERDAAQDGYIQRIIDGILIRFRVSVLPIASVNHEIRAESIVIRVLDDRKVITNLRQLGLLEQALERFNEAIRQPHGMVILTGPTGSGKSTTLFAALHQVITPKINVLTVEDPVEYIIPGVRQIKLNHKLALDDAIRSILRHDPDVVMVGEMRDRATAELAIKLANTGHLTLSTLHTNDAPSAVSRLYKMGIEPFLIAYAINLVVSQRLIRNLCPACKVPAGTPEPHLLERLGFSEQEIASTSFFTANHKSHCDTCKGNGYKGRRAITETMPFSPEIRRLILAAKDMIDEGVLRSQAVAEGMLTLQASARELLKQGETSIEEMIRVVTTI